MRFLKLLIMSAIIPVILSTVPRSKPSEYKVRGSVASKETGKPLANIYLYTVKGEEEAITNQKGEFSLVSWQKLPVTLYIHKEDENVRVLISNPSQFIKIKL